MTNTKFSLPTSDYLKQAEKRVFLGVRGKAKIDICIKKPAGGLPVIIPKGSNIIIQPLNADHKNEVPRFKITCFKADNTADQNNLPENQRNIIIGNSYWAEIDDPKKAFLFDEQYQNSNKPLFSSDKSPALADIKQGQIPDCFLLAAIQAILNHPDGATFIRGMMRQNDDGTTTVRLFDPKTQKPQYFRINTAVLINQQGELNYHKELWVHVLESAYAAMGKHTDKTVDSSSSSVFNGGGSASMAGSILTGLNHKSIELKNSSHFLLESIDPDIFSLKDMLENFQMDEATINQSLIALLHNSLEEVSKIYSNSMTVLEALTQYKPYFDFYAKNQESCKKITEQPYDNGRKLVEMIELVSSIAEPEECLKILELLKNALNYYTVPLPDVDMTVRTEPPAFSGFYSETQNNHYFTMKSALEKGQLITAGTDDTFSNISGLRSLHAYTVLNVLQREEKAFDAVLQKEITRTVRYVQLRNPWGNTGRKYQQKPGQLEFIPFEDKNADIFEIELADFVQYFYCIVISESANQQFSTDKLRLNIINSIGTILKNCRIDTLSTLDDLCLFQYNYIEYETKLIDLENLVLKNMSLDVMQQIDAIFSEKKSLFIEKNEICRLLEQSFPDEFNNNEQNKTFEQCYRLLKLQWLNKQDSLDEHELSNLKATIVKNAHYDFCPIMANEKNKMVIMMAAYERDFLREINALNIAIDNIQQKDTLSDEEMIELNARLIYISTIKAPLSRLGIISSEQLNVFNIQCDAINELVSKHQALSANYSQQMTRVMSEAAELYKTGHISLSERNYIKELAKHMDVDLSTKNELNQLVDELQTSNDVYRQKLGHQIKLLTHLSEAFHKIIGAFKTTINQLKSIFHIKENSYDLPADSKETFENKPSLSMK